MAPTVDRGKSLRRSVGAIASFAGRSNYHSAAGDWTRRDLRHEAKGARKTQGPRSVVGKDCCHNEELSRLNTIAGAGGNPEATRPLIRCGVAQKAGIPPTKTLCNNSCGQLEMAKD